jgi:phosphohistidine phosphatase
VPYDAVHMKARTPLNLYILRHGIAVERGTPGYTNDADRPLTPEGKRKLWQITKAMAALEPRFDLILSSPYLRARQTAEIVVAAFKARKKLQFCDHLTPDGNTKKLVEFLKSLRPWPESVLLVGHEPYLSELISLLVAGDGSFFLTLKKGGLVKLTAESLRPGRCARLEWLLTPKQMALMA